MVCSHTVRDLRLNMLSKCSLAFPSELGTMLLLLLVAEEAMTCAAMALREERDSGNLPSLPIPTTPPPPPDKADPTTAVAGNSSEGIKDEEEDEEAGNCCMAEKVTAIPVECAGSMVAVGVGCGGGGGRASEEGGAEDSSAPPAAADDESGGDPGGSDDDNKPGITKHHMKNSNPAKKDTIGKGISRGAEWCQFQCRSTFQ